MTWFRILTYNQINTCKNTTKEFYLWSIGSTSNFLYIRSTYLFFFFQFSIKSNKKYIIKFRVTDALMSQTDHIKKKDAPRKQKERALRQEPCEDWSCFLSSIGKLLLNIIFCRDASDEPFVNPTAVIYSSPELDENYYSLIFFSSIFWKNSIIWSGFFLQR